MTGATASITSFSFANSQGGAGEYAIGTVTGCTVDGGTLNPGGHDLHRPGYLPAAVSGWQARLTDGGGIALDAAGNLYIADTGDNRVRRLDGTGTITTVAGIGTAGYSGDNSPATSAELSNVSGLDVDAAGNLYLADEGNAAVRLVLALTGTITTIAGNGSACVSASAACGDGGLSAGSTLISPRSAALDSFGNLYIADSSKNRIRMVFVVQPTFTFASVTAGSW